MVPVLVLVFPACVPEQDQGGDLTVFLDTTSSDAGAPDTSGEPTDTAPEGEDAGIFGSDSGTDTDGSENGEDTGPDNSGCSDGLASCGGECVDTSSSDSHCGSCDNACPGAASCDSGTCSCPDGQELCEGQCVDTTTSDDHCGECGTVCSGGQNCRDSQCRCPDGRTFCSGACIDTTADPDNCGGCGDACGAGEVCTQSSCKEDTKVQGVISGTNDVRSTQTDCGTEGTYSSVPPLQGNQYLHEAALAHAQDMAMNNFFDHTGSDGSNFADRIRRTDYGGRPVAENIAAGNSSASATVQQWEDSDGHCKNMMLQRATEIGVGVVRNRSSRYGWYWVQVFGRQ